MPALNDLNAEIFSKSLNSIFEVNSVPLRLIEVHEKNETPHSEQFSLIFRGPREPFLGQGIHRFENAEIGTHEMFAVPIGPDAEGMLYEVIFNRGRRADA